MQASAELAAEQLAKVSKDSDFSVAMGGEWYPAELLGVGLEPSRVDERGAYYLLQVRFAVPAGQLMRAGQPVVVRIGE